MSSNAAERNDWRWAHDLRDEGLGFSAYNVMAIFPSLSAAEDAVERLTGVGVPRGHISVATRTLTDDPSDRSVVPAMEVPARARDARVAGRVGRKVVVLSAATAVAGALIGLIVSLIAGFSAFVTVTTIVASAVGGSVVGAVWGGEVGAMGEARKEEGVVVGAHLDDVGEARKADSELRAIAPLRIDLYDAQGRPISKL